MEEKACVHTMEAFVSPVTSVIALADSPYLITGSKDGSVHFWSSGEFRFHYQTIQHPRNKNWLKRAFATSHNPNLPAATQNRKRFSLTNRVYFALTSAPY
uniref:Uncharacterized protein n=1 Tax=Aegilops tauschii subsp. strangulata TaxID=200361 RepID=A0A453RP00_AEGTS